MTDKPRATKANDYGDLSCKMISARLAGRRTNVDITKSLVDEFQSVWSAAADLHSL